MLNSMKDPIGLGPNAANLSYPARQLLLGQYLDRAQSGELYSDPLWAAWGGEMRRRGMIDHQGMSAPAMRPGPTIDDLIFRIPPGQTASTYKPPITKFPYQVPQGGKLDPMAARVDYAAMRKPGSRAQGTSSAPLQRLKPLPMPPSLKLYPAAIERNKNKVAPNGDKGHKLSPQAQAYIDNLRKNLTDPNASAGSQQRTVPSKIAGTVDNWATFGLADASGKAWGDVDSGHGSKLKAMALTAGLAVAALLAAGTGGEDAVAANLAEHGAEAMVRPGGLLLKKVGGYWVKTVNAKASSVMRWYAKRTLDQQAQAMAKLGDMAPQFLYKNGKLIIKDVGKYKGGLGEYLKIWAKGSKRMGTVFNDIKPRNMGENGQIFDPTLQPGFGTAIKASLGGMGGGAAYNEYQRRHGR